MLTVGSLRGFTDWAANITHLHPNGTQIYGNLKSLNVGFQSYYNASSFNLATVNTRKEGYMLSSIPVYKEELTLDPPHSSAD